MAVHRISPDGRSRSAGARKVADALRFAMRAHLGQTRKDRRTPYIVHPVGVMRVLSSELAVDDPEILSAALLHDVLEDTRATSLQLRARFGARVTQWVSEMTIPSQFHGPAVPNPVKSHVHAEAIGRLSWPAVLIKLADSLDNLRDSANARWSAQKRRAYRDQTRAMLRTFDDRFRDHPPRPTLLTPLRRARRLLTAQLRPYAAEV